MSRRHAEIVPGAEGYTVRDTSANGIYVNGERVQVREIQNGRVALVDGRTLPAGFNTFTHGYAVTSHSSQSRTVDEVILVASYAFVRRRQPRTVLRLHLPRPRGRPRLHR